MSETPPPEPGAHRLKAPLVAGVVLGLLVVGWTFVMGLMGWYLDPAPIDPFWVVIAIQTVVLVATLARTRQDRVYGAQVGVGLMTSAVAAVIVFIGSLLFTTVAFPDYFADLRRVRERILREQGMAEAEIVEVMDRVASSQTPTGQAFAGFMGTLGTGLVVSLAAAAVLRDRASRPT